MVREPKAVKKPYVAPSFQLHGATSAKAALKTGGAQNPQVEEMLVLINRRLDDKTSTSGS